MAPLVSVASKPHTFSKKNPPKNKPGTTFFTYSYKHNESTFNQNMTVHKTLHWAGA